MKSRVVRIVALVGGLFVAGCMDVPSPTDLSLDLAILDAEYGDDGSGFYFLPPMVPNPGATGVFDATQSAVVEVCEWTGSECALAITDFSVESGTISVSDEDETYLALWHAGDFELDLSKLYRVRVLVGAQELGYADIQPVSNGSGLKNIETGEVIGLVDNRTLPVKFCIEEGAIGTPGVSFDATALTAPTFAISGVGSFSSGAPVVLDLSPGSYNVLDGSGGLHAFEVTPTGLISYGPGKEAFLDGAGTTQLTLVGYSVTVDADLMTAGSYAVGGIGSFSSGTVGTFTFLPGVKTIQEGSTGVHAFEVTAAGLVSYGLVKEPFLDGSGTTQLTLVGYSVNIDATALTASTYAIGGIGSFPSASVGTLTVLPGTKSFSSTDVVFSFDVQEDGSVDYDTSLDPILDGRGGSLLTVSPGSP